MPEIPECLNRRYKALDQLIKELSAMPNHRTTENHSANKYTHEPGIKLMCDFWKILKEDPGCDLRQAVKEQMGLNAHAACSSFPNEVACYMAGRTKDNPKPDGCEWHSGKNRGQDNPGDDGKNAMDRIRRLYCESHCANREKKDSTESVKKSSEMPLTKALCCLKEAASLDKKCNLQVMELMEAQKELKDQIESLEQREKEGTELINQADGMWITMEEEYKEKIAQSLEKQKEMVKKLKEVEASNSKWRRNKKELEDQIKSVNKSLQDLADKISRKNNDIKCIELEIGEFTKRVNNNKRAEETGKQNLINKRTAFDKKMAGYNANIVTLTNELAFLQNQRKDKETEGSKVVRDAREDTQKICRLLLQKRMENEELIVENEGILKEIELLKQTCDQCKDKCSTKRNNLDEEIKKVDKEIADYKYQCVRCHQCTDTEDARRLCSDCPRCKETRECTTVGDHCERDASYDCVCVHVKEKFLNNVFENMYTVLERQSRSKPGKVLAESIVKSLNNSRNGKLDGETRRLVQDFVLNSVRKNLNLTIVGGAVKTRCELDPKTYGQLMSCLTSVKVVEPPKEDKGTEAKKDSCRRWGGSQECNCPGGAKECICIQRAPPPLHKEPTPYPTIPEKDEDSSQNPKNAKVRCPRKEPETCGSNCGATVKEENAEETCNTKPNKICETNECPFKRIVRSSQCGIGPESLASEPNTYIAAVPCMPTASGLEYKKSCKCGGINPKTCKCGKDAKQLKAGLITNSTSTNDDNKFSNEDLKLFYKDENVENINKRKPILPSMSQQANALAESVFEEPNEACAKSKGSVNDEGTLSGTSGLEINNKLLDLIDKQYKENPDISVNLKNIDSDKPGSEYIKDNYKIKISKTPSGNRLFKITKTVTKSAPQDVVKTEPKSVNTAINYDDTSEISIMYSNDKLWAIDDMKSELQQKYANDEPIYIVLRTESRTFKIKSPVKKTLSGNIAVDIKKLGNNLKVQHSEGVIVLTRSDSGAIIINESVDGNGNAVIRNTASGAFLMVLIDSSKRTCSKEEPLKDKYFKVKIKSDDFDLDDPPAVLKSTPSQNYIFVPDKEYESRYKRAVNDTLDSSAEYYVNLTKTDSENCVLRVDDSWDDIKPNAVVVKSNSGDIKIINRKSTFLSLPPEQKRISDTSSSKALSNIINNVPNKVSTNSRRSSDYSKRSITSHKSCSESNIYQKVKLFYSDPKNFPAEPSPVLKMMSPGEYAVILGKESKISFIKNLKSYLENNFQGLVPIKRTDSGEVTIALNAEHTNKNDYGSLKITPSGNLYVIVDKELIAGMCEEEEDFLSTSTERATVNDVASRHIIRKLQHPVNRGVSTTCHGMPTSDCNKPLCVCSDIEFDIDNINWIYNDKNVKTINYFASAICGINWRRATSNIYPITVPYDKSAESLDNTTVSGIKELPHIIIKPFIDESLTNSFETKQQHCFSVIETVCPFKENSETTWEKIRARQNAEMNSSWDSLSFLPPQLPQFLKDVKY